jgi:hypothetical protein
MTIYRSLVAIFALAQFLSCSPAAYAQRECLVEEFVDICIAHSGSLEELERWVQETGLSWKRSGNSKNGGMRVTAESGLVYQFGFQKYSDLTSIRCVGGPRLIEADMSPGEIVLSLELTQCKVHAAEHYLPDFVLIDTGPWVATDKVGDHEVSSRISVYQRETENQRVTVTVLEQRLTDNTIDAWNAVLVVDKVILDTPS